MKKFFICKLFLLLIVGFSVIAHAEEVDPPVLGACKQFGVSSTSIEVSNGIQFSHSGFWHQVADDADPFNYAIAETAEGKTFRAEFRDCRQGVLHKECYYGWRDYIPGRRGLKINLKLYRETRNCEETFSQDDVDQYLAQKKIEADKQAKLAEIRRQFDEKIDVFNDECIFIVMPESPNSLVSQSVSQLCRSLAQRYAEQGFLNLKSFVVEGDQSTARLVCNIKDSWTRSDPTFLKSVEGRCDRFARSSDQSFIRRYPMSDIKNLTRVLESPVLHSESN